MMLRLSCKRLIIVSKNEYLKLVSSICVYYCDCKYSIIVILYMTPLYDIEFESPSRRES